MLSKNYDNLSSNNEVIAKTSSTFLNFSKHFLNQRLVALRRSLLVCFMLTIFTSLETTDSENCQNILHHFNKEGYIQSRVGSHIITGVP